MLLIVEFCYVIVECYKYNCIYVKYKIIYLNVKNYINQK